jgi:hypothetical protein
MNVLGHADSFAAMLAVTLKATLVSADPSFEKLGKTLKWVYSTRRTTIATLPKTSSKQIKATSPTSSPSTDSR